MTDEAITAEEAEGVLKTSRARIMYQRSVGRKPALIDLALQYYADLASQAAIKED